MVNSEVIWRLKAQEVPPQKEKKRGNGVVATADERMTSEGCYSWYFPSLVSTLALSPAGLVYTAI